MIENINVSRPQMDFLEAKEKYVLFCGGIRGGKTWAGAFWAYLMVAQFSKCNGLITAGSYGQLQKATLPKFFEMLDMFNVPYEYLKQSHEVIVNKTTRIFVASMEKYDNIRGIEVGWIWADECAFYRPEAFDVMIGRLSDKRGPCVWRGTTTPNGFNWLYDRFMGQNSDNRRVIFSSTKENLANLPDTFIEDIRGQYDSKLAKQELEGKFVNIQSGLIYYAFDRDIHTFDYEVDGEPITLGLDFNVDPMCGVYCVKKEGIIYAIDELYQRDSNTFQASKEILDRYPWWKVQVAADATGNRRKTSSSMTDHEILRRAQLDVLSFNNPKIKDRYNNINRLFYNNKLMISRKCTKLIEDLEQFIYDNDNDMLGHASDALGYASWHLDPLRKPRRIGSIR